MRFGSDQFLKLDLGDKVFLQASCTALFGPYEAPPPSFVIGGGVGKWNAVRVRFDKYRYDNNGDVEAYLFEGPGCTVILINDEDLAA